MVLSEKETMLLKDLKSQEELCIQKYGEYSQRAKDTQLKDMFNQIMQTEQGHLDTINQMIGGTVPQPNGGRQQQQQQQITPSSYSNEDKSGDCYLCSDALANEKHVSSVYDISIFEFKDANARNILNHIQKEEQEHGKRIYDFMAINGMYA